MAEMRYDILSDKEREMRLLALSFSTSEAQTMKLTNLHDGCGGGVVGVRYSS